MLQESGADGVVSAIAGLLTLGGPIVLVLVAMSIFALSIVILKLWQFASLGGSSLRRTRASVELWRNGEAEAAARNMEATDGPVARVVRRAMQGLVAGQPEAHVRESVEQTAASELAGLRAYLRGIETVAQAAPLIGLLGTVIGMIEAFQVLESSGGDVDPAGLAGGIWVALLTTAVGLIVAIPFSVVLAWFDGRIGRERRHMEALSTEVFTHPPVALAPRAEAPVVLPRAAGAAHAH